MNKSNSRLHQFCACTGYSVNRYRPDSILYIFQCTLMCDSVLSVIDLDWTVYSAQTSVHCNIVLGF